MAFATTLVAQDNDTGGASFQDGSPLKVIIVTSGIVFLISLWNGCVVILA